MRGTESCCARKRAAIARPLSNRSKRTSSQEERLFAECASGYTPVRKADTFTLGRYNPKAWSPSSRSTRRTTAPRARSAERARGAVLLVHGLTDSPYSMRGIAEVFQARGFYVVALRIPGHGTIPSMLRDVRWEDWYAAVVVAAKHAAERAEAASLFTSPVIRPAPRWRRSMRFARSTTPTLPRPQGVYLVSAAIGISPFAVLTDVIAGLAFIPAFEKSSWIDVLPGIRSVQVQLVPRQRRRTKSIRSRASCTPRSKTRAARPSRGDAARHRLSVARRLDHHGRRNRHPACSRSCRRRPRARHLRCGPDDATQGLIAPGPLEDLETIRNATNLPYRVTLVGTSSMTLARSPPIRAKRAPPR